MKSIGIILKVTATNTVTGVTITVDKVFKELSVTNKTVEKVVVKLSAELLANIAAEFLG